MFGQILHFIILKNTNNDIVNNNLHRTQININSFNEISKSAEFGQMFKIYSDKNITKN